MVQFLAPPVIFFEHYTEVWFDPKSTMSKIQKLKSDEMPFVNTEIGGSKLDFEFLVTDKTGSRFQGYNSQLASWVKGKVGEMPIGHDKDIKMLWETGYANVAQNRAKHCTYDMKKCYYAQNVPVIFDVDKHSGYITGGQNVTIHGAGFDSGKLSVKVAGVDCKVTSFTANTITCETEKTVKATFPKVAKAPANNAANSG
jgi:hypothetical protein